MYLITLGGQRLKNVFTYGVVKLSRVFKLRGTNSKWQLTSKNKKVGKKRKCRNEKSVSNKNKVYGKKNKVH